MYSVAIQHFVIQLVLSLHYCGGQDGSRFRQVIIAWDIITLLDIAIVTIFYRILRVISGTRRAAAKGLVPIGFFCNNKLFKPGMVKWLMEKCG